MRITVGYGDPARGQVRKLLRVIIIPWQFRVLAMVQFSKFFGGASELAVCGQA